MKNGNNHNALLDKTEIPDTYVLLAKKPERKFEERNGAALQNNQRSRQKNRAVEAHVWCAF